MGDMRELLEVDSDRAFRFFFVHLNDEVIPMKGGASEAETFYVASVLAHYAQTSRHEATCMSPSGSLYDLLDDFVLVELTAEGSAGLKDPEILEVAGSHTLLLVGFFRDQMKKNHNLGWYDQLGCSFFVRAGARSKERKKAELLRQVGVNFAFWAAICRNLSRTLRDERYLLKLN